MATTVEQFMTDVFRMLSVVGDGASMSSSEADDGVRTFNRVVRRLFGTLIGVKLSPETAATGNIRNGALYEAGASAVTLTCPTNPKAGWRFGVTDAKAALSSNNVTVSPNGRKFKGVATNGTLSTNNLSETYFFRDDTGDWVLEANLTLTDNVYFPDELHDGLAAMVACAIANGYGKEAAPSTKQLAAAGEEQFRHRYGRAGTVAPLIQTVAAGGS